MSRMVKIIARPPAHRYTGNGELATRKIGNALVFGGEAGTAELSEAIDLVINGDVELAPGESLTAQEQRFAEAKADHLWPAKHGRHARLEDFA